MLNARPWIMIYPLPQCEASHSHHRTRIGSVAAYTAFTAQPWIVHYSGKNSSSRMRSVSAFSAGVGASSSAEADIASRPNEQLADDYKRIFFCMALTSHRFKAVCTLIFLQLMFNNFKWRKKLSSSVSSEKFPEQFFLTIHFFVDFVGLSHYFSWIKTNEKFSLKNANVLRVVK